MQKFGLHFTTLFTTALTRISPSLFERRIKKGKFAMMKPPEKTQAMQCFSLYYYFMYTYKLKVLFSNVRYVLTVSPALRRPMHNELCIP